MKIKVIYRKNLKMSEGKIAAQVAHAVKNLGETPKDCSIIVLKVSDKKFDEIRVLNSGYTQVDLGLTEIEKNTPTAFAWIEKNNDMETNEEKIRQKRGFYIDILNDITKNCDMETRTSVEKLFRQAIVYLEDQAKQRGFIEGTSLALKKTSEFCLKTESDIMSTLEVK